MRKKIDPNLRERCVPIRLFMRVRVVHFTLVLCDQADQYWVTSRLSTSEGWGFMVQDVLSIFVLYSYLSNSSQTNRFVCLKVSAAERFALKYSKNLRVTYEITVLKRVELSHPFVTKLTRGWIHIWPTVNIATGDSVFGAINTLKSGAVDSTWKGNGNHFGPLQLAFVATSETFYVLAWISTLTPPYDPYHPFTPSLSSTFYHSYGPGSEDTTRNFNQRSSVLLCWRRSVRLARRSC